MKSVSNLKKKYIAAKLAKIGCEVVCPSCGTVFIKKNFQQAFCKSKSGTMCKDYYWNNVTPSKRNNTTRISPANALWMRKQKIVRSSNIRRTDEGYRIIDGVAYDEFDDPMYAVDMDEHPFSCEGLGQWDD